MSFSGPQSWRRNRYLRRFQRHGDLVQILHTAFAGRPIELILDGGPLQSAVWTGAAAETCFYRRATKEDWATVRKQTTVRSTSRYIRFASPPSRDTAVPLRAEQRALEKVAVLQQALKSACFRPARTSGPSVHGWTDDGDKVLPGRLAVARARREDTYKRLEREVEKRKRNHRSGRAHSFSRGSKNSLRVRTRPPARAGLERSARTSRATHAAESVRDEGRRSGVVGRPRLRHTRQRRHVPHRAFRRCGRVDSRARGTSQARERRYVRGGDERHALPRTGVAITNLDATPQRPPSWS